MSKRLMYSPQNKCLLTSHNFFSIFTAGSSFIKFRVVDHVVHSKNSYKCVNSRTGYHVNGRNKDCRQVSVSQIKKPRIKLGLCLVLVGSMQAREMPAGRSCGGHLVWLPLQAGELPALTRSAVALSGWILKASSDGNPTISLGSLLHC